MKTIKNMSNVLTASLRSLAVVAVFAFTTNCSDEQELVNNETTPATEEVAAATETNEAPSLTVSGAFVEYSDESSCASCTYVIPEDATTVDGQKLGFKPGDVICLNSTFNYKAIEFVNVEGAEGEPIIIANCGE